MKHAQPYRIVVAGDVTLDWSVARDQRTTGRSLTWNAEDRVRASWDWGGAALLADLVRHSLHGVSGEAGFSVHGPDVEHLAVSQSTTDLPHSYTMWNPDDTRKAGQEVWRIREFLGMHEAHCEETSPYMQLTGNPEGADLVLLDDAALRFRDCLGLWPAAIEDGATCGAIVLKMARPVARGHLWDHLVAHHAERLVVVVDVEDLRQSEVQVSRGLSWERSAQDAYWELTRNAQVNALSRCLHVVVSFGRSGALILSRRPKPALADEALGAWDARLCFDRLTIEGVPGSTDAGQVVGYTTCLAAALARQIAACGNLPDAPCIERGVEAGIGAMRALYDQGFGPHNPGADIAPPQFPVDAVVPHLSGEIGLPAESSWVTVRSPTGTRRAGQDGEQWSILAEHCSGHEGPEQEVVRTVQTVARQIAKHGPDQALQGVPTGKFGKLLTADRREVEGLNSIRALLDSYCRAPLGNPLSIAVFGPPGSGKSFAVKQVAALIDVGDRIDECTFNLSQLNDPAQLVDALHQVRDVGLRSKIPLVFWDEFDTSLDAAKLGWLRYFLAPMQDGAFQDKQITHHIGHAIFVFAGGTAACMADFNRGGADGAFRQAKGPDFVSRLSGFVDIMGPNPMDPDDPGADPNFLIRRATLLRSLLSRNTPHVFSDGNGGGELRIDSGVLRGLLETPFYKHGARSMQSIIGMSWLNDRAVFERSSLPPSELLDLHVEGARFLDLVQQPDLEEANLEPMARALHVFHSTGKVTTGDEAADAAVWEEASGIHKEQSRDSVRDIFRKLAAAGHVMVREASGPVPILDEGSTGFQWMAYAEHERWRAEKQTDGWRWGEERDDDKRLNPLLLPWRKISDKDRERTENLVRAIPSILRRAGYTIRRLETATSPEIEAYEADRQRLRVGIVGHRLMGDAATLAGPVNEALGHLAEAWPARPVRLLATLSEGASRLVAELGLRHPGADLAVVLPLPEDEYTNDFTSPESEGEFRFLLGRAQSCADLAAQPSRSAAYAAADNHIVDEADMLIALWDGRQAGGPGGTAESVARANAQGLPTIHVVVRTDGTKTPQGDEHGALRLVNWPPTKQ